MACGTVEASSLPILSLMRMANAVLAATCGGAVLNSGRWLGGPSCACGADGLGSWPRQRPTRLGIGTPG
jgi:hypothetical protein